MSVNNLSEQVNKEINKENKQRICNALRLRLDSLRKAQHETNLMCDLQIGETMILKESAELKTVVTAVSGGWIYEHIRMIRDEKLSGLHEHFLTSSVYVPNCGDFDKNRTETDNKIKEIEEQLYEVEQYLRTH